MNQSLPSPLQSMSPKLLQVQQELRSPLGLAITGLLSGERTVSGLSTDIARVALRAAIRGRPGLEKVLLVPLSGLSEPDLVFLGVKYLHALTGVVQFDMLAEYLGSIS
jgi:hypothetical protein